MIGKIVEEIFYTMVGVAIGGLLLIAAVISALVLAKVFI